MDPVPNTAPRLLPWVASILYVAVLLAAVYFAAAGLCDEPAEPLRVAGFVGVLGFLIGLEVLDRHRPVRLAIAFLALRAALYWVVGVLECSGFSRILFVLIPFLAYFSLGRRASYALAGLLTGGLVVNLSLTTPSWYTDREQLSDLLMFCTGLVMAVSMAAVAVHAERLVGQVARLATVAERNRLARDIHDSLGHHLTVIAVQLEKAAAFRERDPATAEQALADARASTRHALDEVRQSVGTLRAGFALAPALRQLVARLDDERFSVELDVTGDESGFDSAALIALYRAAQEGLTNASRHAGASRVRVRVRLDERAANLVVADDGRGFSGQRPGFGLRGMDERLRLVGGTLSVSDDPDGGTRLVATVPAGGRR
ncbi:MAG TPA: sensor histidine kinase [Actinophytocola sp.]|uniref:sensor histidine kinase n=1 Tax=Actinophytocola sp. TaxID=1872138 RepID=UPI002DB69453|nr:sensor histidine kinase [Actinophytocola sp.]HEU5475079.1 sensor histidine kinase [Actinophytocola sp.]